MSGRYFRDDSSASRRSDRSGREYGGYDAPGYDQDGDDGFDYRSRPPGARDHSAGRSASQQGAQGGYPQGGYPQGGYGRSGQGGPYGPSSFGAGSGGGSGARRPGSPGQPVWGQPAAQPTYPAYGGYGRTGVAAPPGQRKSRRGLWITLGVIVALLLACAGGSVYAASRYFAPAVSAGLFCGYVETQGYAQAYGQMSAGAHSQFTSTQFTDAFSALDSVEGKATACTAATGANSYNASLFGATATVGLVMTRATAGALQGSAHLKKESAGWRVDAIDASLLGVSLGAVVAADSYCAALKAQQYTDAYALLGAQLQSATKQADFVQLAQWHDTIDGQVSACAVTAIAAAASAATTTRTTGAQTSATATPTSAATPTATPTGAGGNAASVSDTSATLTLSLTRGKGAAQQGALTLAVEGDAWRIGGIATPLQGSDLSPLQTGGRFCADLAAANYADAYTLGDSHFYSGMTQSQAVAFLAGTSSASLGVMWSSCTLDASTFKVNSATQVTYKMTVTLTKKSTGQTTQITRLFALLKVSSVWKLHGISTA